MQKPLNSRSPGLTNNDCLSVIGLILRVRVGCTAAERRSPQRLAVDVDMFLPLRSAGKKDDLTHTVDYAVIVDQIKKTISPKIYRLAETVAEDIAKTVLSHKKIKRVTVKVKKKALPGIQYAEIKITRP